MDASAPYFAVQKTQKALTKLSLKSWEYKGRIGLFLVEQVIQGTIYPLGHLPVFNSPNEALPLLFKVKVVKGQFLFSSNCVVNSINHDFRWRTTKNVVQHIVPHYSKSQIFFQKFNFDKTPTFSRLFHPKFFWQFFSWN